MQRIKAVQKTEQKPLSQDVEFEVSDEPNIRWSHSERGRRITVKKAPLFDKKSKIFCMGSCFALEIRHILSNLGFDVSPKYFDIDFDPETQQLGKLPERDNINHYNTFSIKKEFELAFSPRTRRDDEYWIGANRRMLAGLARTAKNWFDKEKGYRDPTRKHVLASNKKAMHDLTDKVDTCIRDGILNADVYIITLGLIELSRDTRTGAFLLNPVDGIPGTEFYLSSFQENLENMQFVCSEILKRFPERKIILTVSPVALTRTMRHGMDVVTANGESKAVLRAVAGQLQRQFENVYYWPSYELSIYEDIFQENGRHVRPESVQKIVTAFLKAYCKDDLGEIAVTESYGQDD